METVKHDAIIKIPASVAVCPICGAEVVVDIDAWEETDDGAWQVSDFGVHVDCSTSPDPGDDSYNSFFYTHWQTPYIDWLPIDHKVTAWLQANYRFEMRPNMRITVETNDHIIVADMQSNWANVINKRTGPLGTLTVPELIAVLHEISTTTAVTAFGLPPHLLVPQGKQHPMTSQTSAAATPIIKAMLGALVRANERHAKKTANIRAALQACLDASRDGEEGDCIFCQCEQGSCDNDCYKDCIMQEVRKALALHKPPEWFSVEDKTPGIDQVVLACCYGRGVYSPVVVDVLSGPGDIPRFFELVGNTEVINVTHWMPIPARPPRK